MSEFFKELSIEECRARIPERYTVLEGAPRLDSRGFPYREYDHFMRPLSDDGFGETAWPQLVVGEPDDTAAAMFSAFFGMLNTFLMRNDFNTIEFRVVPEVATSCDRSVMRFYTRLSAYRRMP